MFYLTFNKKENKLEAAIKKYRKIIDFLQNEIYDLEEEKVESDKLQLAARLNLAMCQLKVNIHLSRLVKLNAFSPCYMWLLI